MSEDYVVWSNEHKRWWRQFGYTNSVAKARRMTKEQADEICRNALPGWPENRPPPELAVPLSHAEAFGWDAEDPEDEAVVSEIFNPPLAGKDLLRAFCEVAATLSRHEGITFDANTASNMARAIVDLWPEAKA